MESIPSGGALPFDILIHVFELLRNEYASLYNCCLVSQVTKVAASKVLYGQVTYSPAYSPVLRLKRRDELSEGFFHSARLPHNSVHVLKVEISGYLSTRPAPLDRLAISLREALVCWTNVHTMVLTPKQYHAELFTEILPLLSNFAYLRDLTVNMSCTDETHAPMLARTGNLERLAIQSPTRAILQLLPEWLSRLSSTLKAFHLTDNCGSVTPGVLRSFLPHIQEIYSFALGLSYSITDEDIFSFLSELPNLSSLTYRYYLQLRPPTTVPRLSHLRSLTVHHAKVGIRSHAAYLCKWVRRLVSSSPLEELRLVCEDSSRGASVSFDAVLSHLTQKHAETLRVLDMTKAFAGQSALRVLFARCMRLEEVGIAVSENVLRVFPTLTCSLHELHTVTIETRNIKRRRVDMTTERAREFIENGPDKLRRLTLNGVVWEGQWLMAEQGDVRFVVQQSTPPKILPWEEGTAANHYGFLRHFH